MWKGLRHRNIVSLIGVTTRPLQLVSEWMPNGNLREYLNKNPGAGRIGLVSFSPLSTVLLILLFLPKLSDVAEGLAYLHARHTTHGDLKGVIAFPGLRCDVLITS